MKTTVLGLFLPLLMVGGGLYLLLCAYLFFTQSSLLYYPDLPDRELRGSPADIGLVYESVYLLTEDNVRLHGWYVPAPDQRGALLFLHGNAGNISHRLDSLRIFNRLGLSILIIDYRGYGNSEGQVSEQGTYLDAEAAWQFLRREQGFAASEIIVFGRSLGGAVAANLAGNRRPAGLILESVFTSVPDLAAELYPVFPVKLLSRYRYDTLQAVRQVTCPILVIHSAADEIVPHAHGLKIYEAASEPKYLLQIRGGHNDGFLASGSLYVDGLDRFIKELAGTGG